MFALNWWSPASYLRRCVRYAFWPYETQKANSQNVLPQVHALKHFGARSSIHTLSITALACHAFAHYSIVVPTTVLLEIIQDTRCKRHTFHNENRRSRTYFTQSTSPICVVFVASSLRSWPKTQPTRGMEPSDKRLTNRRRIWQQCDTPIDGTRQVRLVAPPSYHPPNPLIQSPGCIGNVVPWLIRWGWGCSLD